MSGCDSGTDFYGAYTVGVCFIGLGIESVWMKQPDPYHLILPPTAPPIVKSTVPQYTYSHPQPHPHSHSVLHICYSTYSSACLSPSPPTLTAPPPCSISATQPTALPVSLPPLPRSLPHPLAPYLLLNLQLCLSLSLPSHAHCPTPLLHT